MATLSMQAILTPFNCHIISPPRTIEECNYLLTDLKPHSNEPSYSNTVIGTLAVDGWAVTFGTVRRGLDGAVARPGPSSLYQMQQPTHQRPVYQFRIIRCGTIIAFEFKELMFTSFLVSVASLHCPVNSAFIYSLDNTVVTMRCKTHFHHISPVKVQKADQFK